MQMEARGFAYDIGFQYQTGIAGLKLGFVMKNIGPDVQFAGANLENRVRYPGDDPQAPQKTVQLSLASFELPTFVQFGTSYEYNVTHDHTIILSGALRNNSFNKDEVSGGVEFQHKNTFFLRG